VFRISLTSDARQSLFSFSPGIIALLQRLSYDIFHLLGEERSCQRQ